MADPVSVGTIIRVGAQVLPLVGGLLGRGGKTRRRAAEAQRETVERLRGLSDAEREQIRTEARRKTGRRAAEPTAPRRPRFGGDPQIFPRPVPQPDVVPTGQQFDPRGQQAVEDSFTLGETGDITLGAEARGGFPVSEPSVPTDIEGGFGGLQGPFPEGSTPIIISRAVAAFVGRLFGPLLVGGIFSEDIGEPGGEIVPEGRIGIIFPEPFGPPVSQAQFPDVPSPVTEIPADFPARRVGEIDVGQIPRGRFEEIQVQAVRRTQPAPASAPATVPPIPAGLIRNLERLLLIGGLTASLTREQGATVVTPTAPEIVFPEPSPTPVPPAPIAPSPSPFLPSGLQVEPALSPALVRAQERARTRDKDCQIVKRRRRRKGVCREGYFVERPGETEFTTWRTKECLSGVVLTEK